MGPWLNIIIKWWANLVQGPYLKIIVMTMKILLGICAAYLIAQLLILLVCAMPLADLETAKMCLL